MLRSQTGFRITGYGHHFSDLYAGGLEGHGAICVEFASPHNDGAVSSATDPIIYIGRTHHCRCLVATQSEHSAPSQSPGTTWCRACTARTTGPAMESRCSRHRLCLCFLRGYEPAFAWSTAFVAAKLHSPCSSTAIAVKTVPFLAMGLSLIYVAHSKTRQYLHVSSLLTLRFGVVVAVAVDVAVAAAAAADVVNTCSFVQRSPLRPAAAVVTTSSRSRPKRRWIRQCCIISLVPHWVVTVP